MLKTDSLQISTAFIISLLFTAFSFLPLFSFAHDGNFDITVTGTVVDASANPLPGATVALKGSNRVTTTDVNGTFSLSVPSTSGTLIVTFTGYQTLEFPISADQMTIKLQVNTTDLAQVVVVGYGTQRQRDVTGAVKSLRAEAFNKGIVNNPQQLLQGKVAGVNVTSASGEPGAIANISIRGVGGVRTGSTPLFVVDGLPLDNSTTGGGDPLNFINSQDIESIDVLKDASATAIYGSRGANGVILITTRKGRTGASNLTASSSIGISTIARKLDVLSADEFRQEVSKLGGTLDDQKGNTDWQKEVTRQAITQNYNLSLSGGADKLVYYASFGMQKQQGIIKANNLDRYTGRFNATQKFLDDRLVVDANLSVATTKNNRPPVQNILGDAISNNPTYPAKDANGNPAQYQNINNPLIYFNLDKDITTINRVLANISPSLRIVKGLVYRLNFGIDNSNATRDVQALPNAVPLREGRLENYYNWNRNTLVENYFTYTWKKSRHDVSALAGHSYQKIFVQGRSNSINRFAISSIEPIYNPGLGQDLTLANNRPTGFAFINELQSFFGRVTYAFDSKYLVTANFRADGSSKFGENNKYGLFPSFSLGWKINEESFMQNSIFSNLKLRAGFGITGNQEIPSKITQALFTSTISASTSYPLSAAPPYPAGTAYSRLANPDIQWEKSQQTNVGLDFGLLNGALTGAIDVFNKKSDNILLEVIPADPVQPAPSLWTNVENMTITNKGVEVDLNYRKVMKSSFLLNLGGNLTLIKNKVENSPYTVIPSGAASGSGLTSATVNGYLNGEAIGTYYLKEFTGFDANGLSTYNDLDKDGIVTDKDRIAAGSALPDVLYSFFGTTEYKGFELNANFNGVAGNKIYDNTANSIFYKLKLSKNVNTTREALQYSQESVNNSAPVSTRYLKDGAYLRLNNLSLSYSLNTKSMSMGKYISALRFSITGQNLFVSTKYDGYDPEVNTDRAVNNISSYGIDYLSYPKAKSIIFSLNVSL